MTSSTRRSKYCASPEVNVMCRPRDGLTTTYTPINDKNLRNTTSPTPNRRQNATKNAKSNNTEDTNEILRSSSTTESPTIASYLASSLANSLVVAIVVAVSVLLGLSIVTLSTLVWKCGLVSKYLPKRDLFNRRYLPCCSSSSSPNEQMNLILLTIREEIQTAISNAIRESDAKLARMLKPLLDAAKNQAPSNEVVPCLSTTIQSLREYDNQKYVEIIDMLEELGRRLDELDKRLQGSFETRSETTV
ncbi:uncharacterized protein LOC134184991 isoform X2 [Corticium candelabrum]|nr:uncharacterized protein LOC134184991 isoform X2 [Corticium candelabrum]